MDNLLNVSFLTTFYFWIAVIMTALFIVKLVIFSLFGMDDGDGDLIGTDVDDGFNFISLQSVLAFFMGFGWAGYGALEFNLGGKISVIVAIIFGLVLMFLTVYLMFLVKKLNSTPKYDLNTLVEKTGTSYIRFDAKGSGKIQIEFNGRLETLEAWNDTDKEIESFKKIKVTRVEDNKIFVCEIE